MTLAKYNVNGATYEWKAVLRKQASPVWSLPARCSVPLLFQEAVVLQCKLSSCHRQVAVSSAFLFSRTSKIRFICTQVAARDSFLSDCLSVSFLDQNQSGIQLP